MKSVRLTSNSIPADALRGPESGVGAHVMRATKLPRILAAVAAVILLLTAALHARGYANVSKAVSAAGIPPFLRQTSPGLWLFFAWHLLALAALACWAGVRGIPSARPVLVFCTAMVIVDTAFAYSLGGLFEGTFMLAASAVLLLAATLRWSPRDKQHNRT